MDMAAAAAAAAAAAVGVWAAHTTAGEIETLEPGGWLPFCKMSDKDRSASVVQLSSENSLISYARAARQGSPPPPLRSPQPPLPPLPPPPPPSLPKSSKKQETIREVPTPQKNQAQALSDKTLL